MTEQGCRIGSTLASDWIEIRIEVDRRFRQSGCVWLWGSNLKKAVRYLALAGICPLTAFLASSALGSRVDSSPFGAAGDARASALVSKMTLDEKIQLVHGIGIPNLGMGGPFPVWAKGAGYIPGIPRLGIPSIASADAAAGVSVKGSGATALPAPIALAATWDEAVAAAYGARIAKELRALGYAEALNGGINLAREPRSGRTFEYMGEDPVLAGTMGAAMTRGVQSQKVIATIKHFALNGQETNRMKSNSIGDERTMRETELLAFEIAVKEGHPGNVMCSYNLVNGIYACENPYLLNTVLKNEWGFKGVVQSDWGATHSTVDAANAGLDEEQPGEVGVDVEKKVPIFVSRFSSKLKEAVSSGTVPTSRLDDMVRRKLAVLIGTGVMDDPPKPNGKVDTASGNADALSFARQSLVLLKNAVPSSARQPVLPLNSRELSSIVVIGGRADSGVLSGGGSANVPASNGNAVANCQYYVNTPMGGCAIWYKSPPLDAIKAKVPNAKVTYYDGIDAMSAADAAARADVAIVFATQWEAEARDLRSLALPDSKSTPISAEYDQNALITAVAAKAKRVIVVLQNGSPVLMPWLPNVHGVLEAWFPGVQGGQAIADVIFGDVNPSGKLPITFPQQDSDLPQKAVSRTELDVKYREDLLMGYRWYDANDIKPLFPFGFGLSYTNFSYSKLKIRADVSNNVTVKFTLKNTGARAGAEVAQVYAQLPSGLGEPPQRLVGWAKVFLAPGQTKEITLAIPVARFATWNVDDHAWRVNPGIYKLNVGGGSRDASALTKDVELSAGQP